MFKKLWKPRPTLTEQSLSWESQVEQYDKWNPPGITHRRYIEQFGRGETPVDCVLWSDNNGELRGILNFFPSGSDFDKPGQFNMFVDPKWKRKGIASQLLDEAINKYKIDLRIQIYTVEGALLVENYMQTRKIKIPL